jgi:hypothetical protein
MQHLAFSCKLLARWHKRKQSPHQRVASEQISLSGEAANLLRPTQMAALAEPVRCQKKHVERTQRGVALPIKTITRQQVTGTTVYCLEVEEDHSFVANGIAVHNCVSQGLKNAVRYLLARMRIWSGMEIKYREPFAPFIYGVSRCAPELGNRKIRGAGSTGAWGIGAVSKFGILWEDDANVPPYSGRIATQWGQGPPKEFYPPALDNCVTQFAEIKSVDEIRSACKANCAITFACMWDFEMKPTMVKGVPVLKPGKEVGGHQTALIDWNDEIDGALNLNSWGDNAYGNIPGYPPCSAYMRSADMARHLRSRNVEVYAVNMVAADLAGPDWRPVGS